MVKHTRRPATSLLKWLLPLALFMALPQGAVGGDWIYTVRPGDNIWQLSQQYLNDPNKWPEVQRLNNINNAQGLQPGTQLAIPVAWLKHQPKPAHLIESYGKVTLINNGQSQSLTATTTINSGDIVRSGADGSATIEFADGSRLLLQPNSEIVMDSLGSFDASGMVDTTVRLQKGRVENRVAPQKPDSRYRIITPAAVAAVRGTEFRVGADDSGDLMRNEVLEGKIAVSGSGVTRDVPTGYGTVAETGKPPSIPQPLPAAPDLSALAKYGSQSGISFRWPEVRNAVRYRAQLAPDERFSVLLRDEIIESNELNWSGLTPTDYALRVRAINALGLEGFDASHRFTVLAPIAAPHATTPEDGAVLVPGKPWIAWSPSPGANSYHLQLAADSQFSSGLMDIGGIVNSHYRPVDDLPAGGYYWRVASISAGIESDFSPARHFVISLPPTVPEAISVTLKVRDASFSWPAMEGAVQYQFQLGRHEDFTNLNVDTLIKENHYSVNLFSAGDYHYRVRAVNGDGHLEPFSSVGLLRVPEVTP